MITTHVLCGTQRDLSAIDASPSWTPSTDFGSAGALGAPASTGLPTV